MNTRKSNKDSHPGQKYLEATRTRAPARSREVIQQEKAAKQAAKDAKAFEQEKEETGEAFVAELQRSEKDVLMRAEKQIPRRRHRKRKFLSNLFKH